MISFFRILASYHPDQEEFRRVRRTIGRHHCPRRYCWYWHSLGFDLELSPDEGCQLTEACTHPRICRRGSGHPGHADYYEPREPHLLEDGFPVEYFSIVGKAYRHRKDERRHRQGRG
jgi:hypothetical protein